MLALPSNVACKLFKVCIELYVLKFAILRGGDVGRGEADAFGGLHRGKGKESRTTDAPCGAPDRFALGGEGVDVA